jgi:hypothetical protein
VTPPSALSLVRGYLAWAQVHRSQEQLAAQPQLAPQRHGVAALAHPQVFFWHWQGFWFDGFGLDGFMTVLLVSTLAGGLRLERRSKDAGITRRGPFFLRSVLVLPRRRFQRRKASTRPPSTGSRWPVVQRA